MLHWAFSRTLERARLTVDENGFLPEGEDSRLANLDMYGMVFTFGQFSEIPRTLRTYRLIWKRAGRPSSDPANSLGEGLPPLEVKKPQKLMSICLCPRALDIPKRDVKFVGF